VTVWDADQPLAGYWPASTWPVECGGNRRQKRSRVPGPRWQPGELAVTRRSNDRWNVMFVERDPGELYLYSTTMVGAGTPVFGRVERLDPISLEALASSPDLPAGEHVWCGAVVAHADGLLYVANGRFVHALDAECRVVAERELDVDGPHNGLVVFPDGTIATKDIRLGPPSSTLTLLAPGSLEVLAVVELPEPSMGRIAADGDDLYVVGDQHLFRYRHGGGRVVLDEGWRPRYRRTGGGLAWDSCLVDGTVWLMDNGDTPGVHAIIEATPSGSALPPSLADRQHEAALSVVGASMADGSIRAASPFPDGGWIIAPPLSTGDAVVCWDTGHDRLAALDAQTLEIRWERPVGVSMQPLLFADTGELLVDDQRDPARYVVLDVSTGEELGAVETGWPPQKNGMFFTPGRARDAYACQPFGYARLHPG
jgi:hypothetical protein